MLAGLQIAAGQAALMSDADTADSALRQALDMYRRLGAADAVRLATELKVPTAAP